MDAIVPLAAAAPLGGKAGALARLIAAGLPVPDGVVVTASAGEAEVRAAAASLAPLAVRSSMSLEDRAGAAAAGVFASRVNVSAADAWDAVCAVRESAGAPLAAAYAHLHGVDVQVAVILQRFVPGGRVTIYTRAPGRPADDEAWIESAGEPARRVTRADADAALAIAAERAIGARHGADVELVVDGDRTWIVQARPIVHPPEAPVLVAPPASLFAFSARTRGVTWRWDLGHNPDPLSPAQTALVAAVDDGNLQVVAGYLYVSDPVPVPLPLPLPDPAVLLSRIRALVSDDAPDVATAVDNYREAYELYANQLAPQIVRTAHAGNTLLAAARGDLSLADVLARIGHHAPAWDVAVPTFSERPELVAAAIARLRAVLPDLPVAPPSIAEEDDDAFALAQRHVRRALLDAGRRANLDDPSDACWLSFEDLATLTPERARARAAAARTASDRARAWAMPLVVRDGAPLLESDELDPDEWSGVGSGGTISGVVHRIDDLGRVALVPPGAVAVVATVTPALALVLAGARAIVAAHGGILDHGAAVARELGIPCVVGCVPAWRHLRDGDLVEISGDAGSVRRR